MNIKIYSSSVATPLGNIFLAADNKGLLLSDFFNSKNFQKKKIPYRITSQSKNDIIQSAEEELTSYFRGDIKKFRTPLSFRGTLFQKGVWSELMNIGCGETISYSEVANRIGKPKAHRAVAMASSLNRLVLVVPCHRVIQANGDLGGYNGGVDRKKWLLSHEKLHRPTNLSLLS